MYLKCGVYVVTADVDRKLSAFHLGLHLSLEQSQVQIISSISRPDIMSVEIPPLVASRVSAKAKDILERV